MANVQALVNTVNTVGVMGKGIAIEFKERFPEMFEDYVQRCQRKEVKPGVPCVPCPVSVRGETPVLTVSGDSTGVYGVGGGNEGLCGAKW